MWSLLHFGHNVLPYNNTYPKKYVLLAQNNRFFVHILLRGGYSMPPQYNYAKVIGEFMPCSGRVAGFYTTVVGPFLTLYFYYRSRRRFSNQREASREDDARRNQPFFLITIFTPLDTEPHISKVMTTAALGPKVYSYY